jgi:cysteinyl-tRNA synthetase
MDDDFNTPGAVAELHGFRSEVNKLLDIGLSTTGRRRVREEFRRLGTVLGLFQLDTWQFNVVVRPPAAKLKLETYAPAVRTGPITDEQIDRLVAERNEARKKKDFARADEIRKTLAEQGIILEDRPDGTTRWKR